MRKKEEEKGLSLLGKGIYDWRGRPLNCKLVLGKYDFRRYSRIGTQSERSSNESVEECTANKTSSVTDIRAATEKGAATQADRVF